LPALAQAFLFGIFRSTVVREDTPNQPAKFAGRCGFDRAAHFSEGTKVSAIRKTDCFIERNRPFKQLSLPIAEDEIKLPEMAPHRTNHCNLNDHFYVSQ
jgi:hypothetical protein